MRWSSRSRRDAPLMGVRNRGRIAQTSALVDNSLNCHRSSAYVTLSSHPSFHASTMTYFPDITFFMSRQRFVSADELGNDSVYNKEKTDSTKTHIQPESWMDARAYPSISHDARLTLTPGMECYCITGQRPSLASQLLRSMIGDWRNWIVTCV